MLNKDTLGQAIYTARQPFNDLTADQLIDQYGSMENARKAICTAEAKAIIDHFVNNAHLTVPGTGLTAGSNAVTGQSTTGTIS